MRVGRPAVPFASAGDGWDLKCQRAPPNLSGRDSGTAVVPRDSNGGFVNSHHLTPADLAQRWGMSIGTLANDRSAGRGPAYVKLGGRVVYRLVDIEAYEAARVVMPVAA